MKNIFSEISLSGQRCRLCSRPLLSTASGYLCPSCMTTKYFDKEYAGNYALSYFSEEIKQTIYQAKFLHNYDYCRFWSSILHTSLLKIDSGYCYILAPSYEHRHIMRIIAKELSFLYGWKIIQDGLLKYQKIPQKTLAFQDRLLAQKDNIYVNPKYTNVIANKKWVILDDIYTTGSTLYYSALALKNAGAIEVKSMTLAITKYS